MEGLIQKLFIFLLWCIGIVVISSCSRKVAELSPSANYNSEQTSPESAALMLPPRKRAEYITIDKLTFGNSRLAPTIPHLYFKQRVQEKVQRFYEGNSFQTRWLRNLEQDSICYTVVDVLSNASHYGLIPAEYDVKSITERLNLVYTGNPVSLVEVIELDIRISEMFFLFTTHLLEGKVRNVGYGNNIWRRPVGEHPMIDVSMLLEAKTSDQLLDAINKLQPESEQYTRLQVALDYYRRLEEVLPYERIATTGSIKPEERNSVIVLIRKKLSRTGITLYPMTIDSLSGSVDSLRYDRNLVDAVKFFQLRHGLEPDGIIGEKTLKFLNQTFREKADIIALNMERMRWLPEGYGENYISVNIPEYRLRVYENREIELEMDVIVGATNKPTPVFSDVLRSVVFSPTWTVPVSIIREEIIPHLQANPAYYSNKNYDFFKNGVEIDPAFETWNAVGANPYQYRVVQRPGYGNSLGLVKFVMQNTMNIYLHDTPNHRLFNRDYRALSHGCIRLDEPARFAKYLLRDQREWNSERIDQAMNKTSPGSVQLKKKYVVHIEYRTAWVDDDGLVNFREDIYGHDQMQLNQLRPVEKILQLL